MSSPSQAFFSPGTACRDAIIHQINTASSHLRICVFTISDDIITEALIKAKRRGINVLIVTDNDKLFDLGSDIIRLSGEGVEIKVDNTSNHMHHKFMLVDDRTLLNGSYNWTRSAAKYNQENIIVTSDREMISLFQKEFNKLWDEMTTYRSAVNT
ncbi:MAG TPA: phospholipase D-like domain-containing protein [Cyclobacteriaceae bacterium]|nr:phospholipase D-like domain-containing protein [Cyclobacteriaceae bacterium]